MRPENVHMDRGRRRHGAARTGHRHHHERGFGDAEPRAADLFGHGDAEPAAVRHGPVEGVREGAVAVACEPVVVVEIGHDLADCVDDGGLVFGKFELHGHVALLGGADRQR